MKDEEKKKPILLYIGKRVPKGFRELPGGIHLGRGIWLLKMCQEPRHE